MYSHESDPSSLESIDYVFGETRKFPVDEIYRSSIDRHYSSNIEKEFSHLVFVICPCISICCSACARKDLALHYNSIVISFDGACKGNGQLDSRAAAGVYVGKGSKHNKSFLISGPQTNQRAELIAAIAAVDEALLIQRQGITLIDENAGFQKRVSQILIRCSSPYKSELS